MAEFPSKKRCTPTPEYTIMLAFCLMCIDTKNSVFLFRVAMDCTSTIDIRVEKGGASQGTLSYLIPVQTPPPSFHYLNPLGTFELLHPPKKLSSWSPRAILHAIDNKRDLHLCSLSTSGCGPQCFTQASCVPAAPDSLLDVFATPNLTTVSREKRK